MTNTVNMMVYAKIVDPDGVEDTLYLSNVPPQLAGVTSYGFKPIILKNGGGRAKYRIDPTTPRVSFTLGQIKLATSYYDASTDLLDLDLVGYRIITGAYWNGVAAAPSYGTIIAIGGESDGTVTIDVELENASALKEQFPTDRYDASTMGVNFPANNDNRIIPWLEGRPQNVTPVLIDKVNFEYQISSNAITVDDVRDAGYTTSYTTTGAGTGCFKLSSSITPDSIITADAYASDGAHTYSYITDIIENMFDKTSASCNVTSNLDVVGGIYLDSETTIANVLDYICRGTLCYWYQSGSSTYYIRQHDAPGTASELITPHIVIGNIKWKYSDFRVWGCDVYYLKNYTVQQQLAASADVDEAEYFRSEGLVASYENTTYQTSTARRLKLESIIYSESDAEDIAELAVTLFGPERKILELTIIIPTPANYISLGADVAILGYSDDDLDGTYVCWGSDLYMQDGYLFQKLVLWG